MLQAKKHKLCYNLGMKIESALIENYNTEFKRNLSKNFEKVIIAFLNTQGGDVFIGKIRLLQKLLVPYVKKENSWIQEQ